LRALADEGQIDTAVVTAAIAQLGIDVNKPNPLTA
jgi:pyruvate dehydrogenase complex dehydrogenase (E1) component